MKLSLETEIPADDLVQQLIPEELSELAIAILRTLPDAQIEDVLAAACPELWEARYQEGFDDAETEREGAEGEANGD